MAPENKKTESYSLSRIVCLSYDLVEILCSIGCSERIIGKPTGIDKPGLENAKSIGGFGNPDIGVIAGLKPDIVFGYSEICADAAAQLTRLNIPTMIFQHTSLDEIYSSITLLGRITGNIPEAAGLVEKMRRQFRELAAYVPKNSRRPVVYFEEWNKPYVCGVQWVSELISIAGGTDGFANRCRAKRYLEREVTAFDVTASAPEIILAAWCGKPVDTASFKKRPGWESVPAVKTGRIYEIPAELILHPGPSLIEGARYISDIINGHAG
jgi:iron complex transport system substrate-binding protein